MTAYPPAPEGALRVADAHGAATALRATHYLYRASLVEFLDDVKQQRLVPELIARFKLLEGHAPSPGEAESWRISLPALAKVLDDEPLRSAHILVELRMPLGGRRCDVLLSGRSPAGAFMAIILELKGWQSVSKSAIPEDVGVGTSSRQHPSAQVRDYVLFLRHYHSAFSAPSAGAGGRPIELLGAAYLHDMTHAASIGLLRDPVVYGSLPTEYPLFMASESRLLAGWLRGHLAGGDGREVADAIASGSPRPSDRLLDVLVDAVQGTHEWRLLDEQRRAFMIIRNAVEEARAGGQKTVVLVRGGPGTGKSVLAIQLLAHGARKHWRVVHATGSQAFQTNLQAKTMRFSIDMMKKMFGSKTRASLPVKELFCTFAHVASLTRPDVFDLVVADEAHRLWRHRMLPRGSGIWKQVSTTPMVEEMIRASRVTAFFLDDNQSVRPEEIGQSQVIEEHARRLGVNLVKVDLELQFRCNGSASYVHWVDALLGYRSDADLAWRRHDAYDFHLDDRLDAMVERIRLKRMARQRCRLVAGFCWPWSEPLGSTLPHDLKHPSFGAWTAPWIEKTEQGLPPLEHRYYRWANEESCADQVGSIYSVQGFEFDHVGVIWGEDLVWRKDRWVFDANRNCDDRFKREIKRTGEDAVAKLRNIYRVLLTRGMQGSSLFVIDDETRARVRSMLEAHRAFDVA